MIHGTCKHYNGSYHNKTCRAGVEYDAVTPNPNLPGSAYRKPCQIVDSEHGLKVLKECGPQGTCALYEEPTQADIEAEEAFFQAALEKTKKTIPLMMKIKKEHQGKNWVGVEICPICHGVLHVSHAAYNGHTHGRCETENCVSWME